MTTMSWNEDLQRTDVKSGPFSQAESDAAKAAARQYAEVRGAGVRVLPVVKQAVTRRVGDRVLMM
jgi:hypothetical protein